MKGAVEVDLNHLLPGSRIKLLYRRGRSGYTCIIDQNVKASEFLRSISHHLRNVLRVANVTYLGDHTR